MSDEPRPAETARASGRGRAAGIYGTIITAALLAAAGDHLSTPAMALGVLVTLVVYWAAEQYAELLAEPTEYGRLPSWSRIRAGFADTWPMVTACYVPVIALVVARALDATPTAAANIALAVAVVLLVVHGRAAGRAAGLRGGQLAVVMLVAGGLGVVMVLLKNLVIVAVH
ncbi:hypothetical protein BJF78_30220 [Pseudonocardia sp. CNS-139]|nr:hypothetical protein BJF78_30220 [Pseudonocardia sp. CNS-139]